MQSKSTAEKIKETCEEKQMNPGEDARQKIEAIRQLERELDEKQEEVAAMQVSLRAGAEELAALRDSLCRLVQFCGGSLEVPGLARALHVKSSRALSYNTDRLAPWLLEHAPHYVNEVTQWCVDKRCLKKELRLRRGKAYLSGIRASVAGIGVTTTHQVVIPKLQDEE